MNGDLTPNDVSAGSQKKVWWQCSKGHEWLAAVCYRNNGGGCPICSGKKVLAGYNDLATLNPELVKEWHPIKNGTLTPSDVTSGSSKKVWWLCEKGHEWDAIICNRSKKKSGCPFCNRRK